MAKKPTMKKKPAYGMVEKETKAQAKQEVKLAAKTKKK
jgi:hypothetical protein